MNRHHTIRYYRKFLIAATLLIGLIGAFIGLHTTVHGKTTRWSQPVDLSVGARSSWFPSLTVAADGSVHVVWAGGRPLTKDSGFSAGSNLANVMDLLMYAVYRNGKWSPANDILFSGLGGAAVRNSIVTGHDGKLYVAFRSSERIFFSSADPEQAFRPLSWRDPRKINGPSGPYYVELAVDSKGTLHVVWTEIVASEERSQYTLCPYCANLFYRNSQDGGLTWSVPVNLADSFDGTTKPHIAIDQQDGIHVVWDIGFDNMSGKGVPRAGGYRYSSDGGITWNPVVRFTLSEGRSSLQPSPLSTSVALPTQTVTPPSTETPANPLIESLSDAPQQTTLGLFQHRDPIVVYRSTQTDRIYYQVSRDNGITWSNPRILHGVRARDLRETPWDAYTMATDGSGNVHLILSGLLDTGNAPTNRQKPSLLHLVWNGAYWSRPEVVVANDLYPEWPRLVVHGQQLHLVWFTRSDEDIFKSDNANYRVWYSSATIDALPLPAVPTFTPAPTDGPTPTIIPSPVPSPTPLPSAIRQVPPPNRYPAWESVALTVMSIALLPVLAFVAIVAIAHSRGMRWRV
jgi:hypothetical protein